MRAKDHSKPASNVTSLDGAWLRRERERMAFTRRHLAAYLRVAVRRLEYVEVRNLPTPVKWLVSLFDLGFRLAVDEPVPATESPSPSPNDTATAAQPKPTETTDPAPLFTGTWLRFHRLRKRLTQQHLSKALGVRPQALSSCEQTNGPLRPEWLAPLHQLGFPIAADQTGSGMPSRAATPPVSPAAPRTSASSRSPDAPAGLQVPSKVTGTWLRSERERLALSPWKVRNHLCVMSTAYMRVERQDLPVPGAWYEPLREIGFLLPETPPQPAPSPPTADRVWRGVSLGQERRRLGFSEAALSRALRIQPDTLIDYPRWTPKTGQ